MNDAQQPDETTPPSPELDPGALKDAHGRTGRMLKNAGLPFEAEEFDEDEDSTSSSSESSEDASSSDASSSDVPSSR